MKKKQARTLWGLITNRLRDLARQIIHLVQDHEPKKLRRICGFIVVNPKFTCFTSTKSTKLTLTHLPGCRCDAEATLARRKGAARTREHPLNTGYSQRAGG